MVSKILPPTSFGLGNCELPLDLSIASLQMNSSTPSHTGPRNREVSEVQELFYVQNFQVVTNGLTIEKDSNVFCSNDVTNL